MNQSLPANPHDWTEADVLTFAEDADDNSVGHALTQLLQAPDAKALEILSYFLGARHGSTFLKPIPSQLGGCALIASGPLGVEVLKAALLKNATEPGIRVRYASALLEMLWNTSLGRPIAPTLLSGRVPYGILGLTPPDGTREAADAAVKEIFAESRTSAGVFNLVASFMSKLAMTQEFSDQTSQVSATLLNVLSEGSIRLSASLLAEFDKLINAQLPEERYQEFLAAHPVFLDPLAAEVVSKQRLGLELATDFAVRSHDDRWLLIEIERPHDRIFTKGRDFRERFTHALGQVLDFQSWVDNNVAYAQTLMKLIAAPRGLLVMGLRSQLDPAAALKLRYFSANSPRIDICTYDDLLARARSLHHSIWHTP